MEKKETPITALPDFVTIAGATRDFLFKEKAISLAPIPYHILMILIGQMNQPVSRESMATEIYGAGNEPGSNVIDYYINQLREKIIKANQIPLKIVTIRGVGYKIQLTQQENES